MHPRRLFHLAVLAACVPTKPATQPEKRSAPPQNAALASGPVPEWIDRDAFADDGEDALHVYAVAACPIEEKDVCWRPSLLLQACRNRALKALAVAIGTSAQSVEDGALTTTATATLEHAAVNKGWYDGSRTIYAVAEQLRPKDAVLPKPLPRAKPAGGAPLYKVEEKMREGARAQLKASGVCEDPHRRSGYACCGPAETFCSDSSRFDGAVVSGRCKCGSSAPCLFDFKCVERQGAKKCICQGAKCPCEGLSCKKGQTCGDGRCY